jgi:sulfite reductase (ferredoxin)
MENFGEDVIRISIRQNLHLRNIPAEYVGNVYEFMKTMTSLFDSSEVVGNIVTCTGADTCKLGLCLPRRVQPEIIKILNDSDLELDKLKNVKIHISGCPNSCGVHHMADLGFFGKAVRKEGKMYPGYNVIGGAKISNGLAEFAQKVGVVPSKNMPEFIRALLGKYLEDTDGSKDFGDWFLEGEGAVVKGLLETFGEAPSYEEDASYYRDWSATEDFSILKGQKAECAASIFDMIDVDKKEINRIVKKIEAGEELDSDQVIYDLVFYTSRMLLVTRSIEANTPEEVFNGFKRAFIGVELIDEKYSALIDLAKADDKSALAGEKDAAVALAQEVIALYGTMDDSLKFSATK